MVMKNMRDTGYFFLPSLNICEISFGISWVEIEFPAPGGCSVTVGHCFHDLPWDVGW